MMVSHMLEILLFSRSTVSQCLSKLFDLVKAKLTTKESIYIGIVRLYQEIRRISEVKVLRFSNGCIYFVPNGASTELKRLVLSSLNH